MVFVHQKMSKFDGCLKIHSENLYDFTCKKHPQFMPIYLNPYSHIF